VKKLGINKYINTQTILFTKFRNFRGRPSTLLYKCTNFSQKNPNGLSFEFGKIKAKNYFHFLRAFSTVSSHGHCKHLLLLNSGSSN